MMREIDDDDLIRLADEGDLESLYQAGRRWERTWSGKSAVTPTRARKWLELAAEGGHRGASLALARSSDVVEPRRRALLQSAYGDGRADPTISQASTHAAAAELAQLLVSEGGDEPSVWFRRALACAPWEEEEADDVSWLATAWKFAEWSHARGCTDLCAAWALQVVGAPGGPSDLSTLREEEHKPWRYDYGNASRREEARAEAVRHLLDEHELHGDAIAFAGLLSDRASFGDDDGDEERVRIALRAAGLPTLGEQTGDTILNWLIRVLIPDVIQAAGCLEADEHRAFALEVPDRVPFKLAAAPREDWWILDDTHKSPLDRHFAIEAYASKIVQYLERSSGLDRGSVDWVADYGRREDRARRALELAGLGAARTWQEDQDFDSTDTSWRLLRRRPILLALWLTIPTADRSEWLREWDTIGAVVAESLLAASDSGQPAREVTRVILFARESLRQQFTSHLGIKSEVWP